MNDELDFLEYFKILNKWRKFIVAFAMALVILTVLVCILMPWTYRADTTLIIPQQSSGLEGILALSSMVSGSTGTVPSDISQPVDLSQSLIGRTVNYTDILKSRTLAGMIVDGLDLNKGHPGRSREALIRMVQKKLKVKELKGILTIYAYDRSPRMAADLANYAVLALDEFNKKGNIQFTKRINNFVRDQLAFAKVDLSESEEKLKKFETQSQMLKISERELMLDRYMRDVKVKEAIYTMLLEEYEKTKIEEAKEELFFEVLDPAPVPKGPNTPKPFLFSFVALVLGGFMGGFLAFLFEYLESIGIKVPQIDYERKIVWNKPKIRIF